MSPAKTGIMGSRTASLTSNVTLAMPTGRKTGVENSVTAFEGKLSHAYSLAVNTQRPLLVLICRFQKWSVAKLSSLHMANTSYNIRNIKHKQKSIMRIHLMAERLTSVLACPSY